MYSAADVIICVIFFAILVLLQCRSKQQMGKYDERQIAVRGSAYKAGFMTIFLCDLLVGIMMLMMNTDFFIKYEMILFIGSAFLGLTVFAVIAILKGAFLTAHQNPVKKIILVIMVVLVNALAAFYKPKWKTPGELFSSVNGINVLIVLCFLIILAVYIIKMLQERRENL